MRLRLAAAALVVLLAAGCGGGGNARRDDVKAYVDRVNAIELKLRRPLVDLARTNRGFQTKTIHKTQVRAARARRTLQVLSKRLHALEPPPDARRLRARLLALVDAEVGVASEVEQLATFLPALQTATRPLGPAQRTLNTELRGAPTRAEQARALDAYAVALASPLRALRALHPPPVMEPVRDQQAGTVTRLRAAATGLAAALRANDARALSKREADLLNAARVADTLPAQRARIAAVRAYNGRVRHLTRLAALVQRERDHLQRTL